MLYLCHLLTDTGKEVQGMTIMACAPSRYKASIFATIAIPAVYNMLELKELLDE